MTDDEIDEVARAAKGVMLGMVIGIVLWSVFLVGVWMAFK